MDAFARETEARGLPLTVLAPRDERLVSKYEAGFALIRPDQHVAWRGDRLPDEPSDVLDRIAGYG